MKWFISKNGIEAVENGQDFIVIYSERDMNSVIDKFDNISKHHFKEIQLVNENDVVQSVPITNNYLTNKTNVILNDSNSSIVKLKSSNVITSGLQITNLTNYYEL